MKTFAQSWEARLAELRAMAREGGGRLDSDLVAGFRRQHATAWWAEFCEAAERGDEIAAPVWRSAHTLTREGFSAGWLSRLRVRNRAARDYRSKATTNPPK